ncbi:hypothetical protein [Streptomyces sp. H51]|uniref:hypothetical protein n=1 Tax=Streptomyces sp. H51 TaxID=3111770 RepID=UPI002D79FA9E|nr:hypothetical protein [Streptomyces sp. H51]
MADTEQQQPADDGLIVARVCIDDTLGPYEARLDPTNRWNGWLCPRFDLDTVRKIAARTQEMADEYGHDTYDTVHVIDGDARRSEHRAVVLVVRWQYLGGEPGEEVEHAVSVISPDADGLYGIGGGEWTWHAAAPDPDARKENTVSEPKWLADAEAEFARREETRAAYEARIAAETADRINNKLDELGITPIRPAAIQNHRALIIPALLVEADPEEELYSVHADWDATARRVRLAAGHFWNDYAGLLPSRPLNSVEDVVLARREGPEQKPEPQHSGPASWDLRKIAEGAARTIASDVTSHDTGEVVQMLSGVAAAVLHLSDTLARTFTRP